MTNNHKRYVKRKEKQKDIDELRKIVSNIGLGKEEERIIADSETKAIMEAQPQVRVRALVDVCVYRLYDNGQDFTKVKHLLRLIMDELEKLGFEGGYLLNQTIDLLKIRYKIEYNVDLQIEVKHLLS